MIDLVALLWIPFLMCLVLTGIHAYLGVHVLAREVVFVDIDSKVKQVYGPAKQGACFGYTKQRGLHFQIVTVKTGTCVLRRTFSVTEPRNSRSNPPRPCVPITSRSAGSVSACRTISLAGIPSTTTTSI